MASERVPFVRVLGDVARATAGFLALAVIATAPSCCLVGLPLFWAFAGAMYLRMMGARRGHVSSWQVGLLGTPIFFAPLVALWIASSLFGALDLTAGGLDLVRLVAPFAVGAVLGVVLFPLYGAPLEVAESADTMLDAVLASGARAARMGLGASLGTGAIIGAVGVLPWLLVPLVQRTLAGPNVMGWLGVGVWLATVAAQIVCLALVAHAHGGGRERFGAARARARPARALVEVRPRLVRSLALAAVPLLLLVPTLLVAIATPTPGWRTEPAGSEERGAIVDGTPLPGSEEGLTISQRGSIWTLRTADGGGAGEVRIPLSSASTGRVARDRVRGRDVWTLRVPVHDHVVLVSFDDGGVRVDDTPTDRIRARLGTIGSALLALHLFALGALLVLALRHTGVAANLERPWLGGYRDTAAILGSETKEAYVERVARRNVLASLPLLLVASGLCVMIVVNL